MDIFWRGTGCRGSDAAQAKVFLYARGLVIRQSCHGEAVPIRRKFRRSIFAKQVLQPESVVILDGTRSATAIDRGWMQPERRSPSKRS
jgi:hypothetical protein